MRYEMGTLGRRWRRASVSRTEMIKGWLLMIVGLAGTSLERAALITVRNGLGGGGLSALVTVRLSSGVVVHSGTSIVARLAFVCGDWIRGSCRGQGTIGSSWLLVRALRVVRFLAQGIVGDLT